MHNKILLVLMWFVPVTLAAQTCYDCRYISPVFDSVTVETVQFGQGPRANGDTQDLYMDIYQPHGDTAINRAVVVFAFGGAFVTGSREDWYVELVGEYLAKAGYIVAAIDYRIYDDVGEMIAEISSGLLIDGVPYHMRTFFRPMQDMRAAVQYLKADYSELGNNYKIDTNKIIIGGASSGAMTSMMTAYCDKESEIEEMGFGSLDPIDDLGGFHSTTGFYPNYNWDVLATLNVAGSIVNTDWIEPGDVPMILAHGDEDNVVPYKKGGLDGITVGSFEMEGSYLVDSVARAIGLCSYLHTMEGKDHPTDDFGIPYFKGVVNDLMLRMHAVIHDRSFCCNLEVSPSADTLFYEAGQGPVSMSATVANDNGNAQLSWCTIACEATSTSSTITVEPDTSLRYLACIAHEGQCQDVQLIAVKEGVPTAVFDKSEVKQFSIAPNPALEKLIINTDASIKGILVIELFDLQGKLVLSEDLPADNQNYQLDISRLAPGSYLAHLHSQENKWQPRKLVVIK